MALDRIQKTLLAIGIVLASAGAGAQAQDYPSRMVRLVVAFPPGGGAEIAARLVAQKMSDTWGKPVVVEARPGAQGSVASEYVAKQPADGYTLLLTTAGSHASAQHLVPNLPYSPFRDFAPVTELASTPFVLAVNAAAPYRTLQEFLDFAKKNAVNYGSSGHGSITHLTGELLALNSGAKLTHVNYKGTGPAVQDLLGQHIHMVIADIGSLRPHAVAGKLRLLAITGAKRSTTSPELQTFGEAGFAGFEAGGWFGVYAPAGTPKPVLTKIAGEITRIVRSQEVSKRIADLGWNPGGGTPDEFFAFWKASADQLGDVVRRAKIKVE